MTGPALPALGVYGCGAVGKNMRPGKSGACVQVGSYGEPEVSALTYYDRTLHKPFASLHVTMLGTCKDFLEWIVERLSTKKRAPGDALVAAFKSAKLVSEVVERRLRHFVLRSTSKCGVCNFVEYLGPMSIAEVQLTFEVVLPYLVHDWVELGVPESVVVMAYAPRPCMLGKRVRL